MTIIERLTEAQQVLEEHTQYDDQEGSGEDLARLTCIDARETIGELLAALQEARDYLADLLNSEDDEVIDNLINNGEEVESRLSAAIAKATQQP